MLTRAALSLVPAWLWLLGGAAIVVGAYAWHASAVDDKRIKDEAVGEARVLARWNAANVKAREIAEQATADNLAEERRRQAALQKEIDHATTALDAARRDADAARRASVGLRDAFASAAARRCAATPNPQAAAAGASAPVAEGRGDVPSDVFGLVEQAGRAMALKADERGIAGAACEAIHDSLTTKEGV
jgi:uncharacterized protein YigA (DUF484 family)